MTKESSKIVTWISSHRRTASLVLALLVVLPVLIFAEATWPLNGRVVTLGVVYGSLGLALAAFLARLYEQVHIGSRFMGLSADLLCIAGFDGYFKRLNSSWRSLLGFTHAELMSRPYLEFVHPEDQALTIAEGQRLREREASVAFENRCVCADGSYKWLAWRAISVPGEQLIYAVARDITALKQAPQPMERHAEGQEREQTRLKLHHDLRTPLNAYPTVCEVPRMVGTPVVLLVDDDPGALRLLEVTLQAAGYATRTALNGKAALSILSVTPVQAALVDLVMPEMDGFELIHRIRRDPALKQLPLLVLTSRYLSKDELTLLAHETQALFQKGRFRGTDLVAALKAAIRERNAVSIVQPT